jgi:hypothetical protein
VPPAAKKPWPHLPKGSLEEKRAANVIANAVKVVRIAIGEETEERPAAGLR